MASKFSSLKQKLFICFLFFLSLTLVLLTTTYRPKPHILKRDLSWFGRGTSSAQNNPRWQDIIAKELKGKKIKIGLVNMDHEPDDHEEHYYKLHGFAETETVSVRFDRVGKDLEWKDLFPEWIDEEKKWGRPSCPEIPMPRLEEYRDVDVVVARVPCGSSEGGKKGVRDVFRLQVNLVVANLVVGSWMNYNVRRKVFVVFIGSCGPMWEIFRCEDLLSHQGDYWVYRPHLGKLKQKVVMPVGSCQLAPSYSEPGKEHWRPQRHWWHREAFVTVLHSSEAYVCGAITLAQSIIKTNSTRDLVLLVDKSISAHSLRGLKEAGWKIKQIERIRSPRAKAGTYNEWNYSKLRVWQLIEYEKVIFIDSDLLLVRNIDDFFTYPQLSAAGNSRVIFNSGVMMVEPSKCMFEALMEKARTLESYNDGDQGFLNEVFTWWHRWPRRVNHLKVFDEPEKSNEQHKILEEVYALHYLGCKPWMCYRDYDCNWDLLSNQRFASDSAHRTWWQLYDSMPKKLQPYCALTKNMDENLSKFREIAKKNNLPDGHWKIKVRDPRHNHSSLL